ncbi:hypothetical protein RHMOL_Rhmol11G0182600 [Rhododendron molle]|uniref:Uncharacterized protein n=1 Tax=Rhododendron molle TaxID=49168 RepID=A0ACC0LV58_RHOML|nr:hypothetical protein RHMOL_Rhmol11G0182600 [Rhododendron molle]
MGTDVVAVIFSAVAALATGAQAFYLRKQVSSDSVKPPKIVEKQGGPDITNFGEPGKEIKKILDALLGSSNVKTIVILGKMGLGKTTMMRNLNAHAEVAKKFDIVIWLKASLEGSRENFSREQLQQLIVARLKLDIGDIGIPKSNNGSKIVLTTRLSRVCASFDTDMQIKVTRLSDEDAWQMFQDVLKETELLGKPSIIKLAFRVCKECCGVPLLIEKVAKTFKSKNTEKDWIKGLNSWKTWPKQECQGIREVYDLLKFCYNDLGDEQYKKCFLYGALYPEDSVINADYLLECWAAENLLGKYKSITEESLIYGHHVLSGLKNVSLLEEVESENYVKMDRFIRQLALYIAEGDHEGKYKVKTSKGLTNASKEKYWTEKINMISFGDNKLQRLPDSPQCRMLSTLFLHINSSLKEIPQSFFDQMEELRVLDVSHTGIEKLPLSPKNSIGLKVLYLNYCKNLADLPTQFVEKLTDLEALDIVESGVNNIPSHIEKLTRLRRLRISFSQSGSATQEVNFNYEVISKLSKLEVLVIKVKPLAIWSAHVEENIMKEVAKLKEFKSLKVCFPDDTVVDVVEVVGSQNLRIRVLDATILLNFIKESSWGNARDIKYFEFFIGSKKSEQSQHPNFHKYEKYVKYCEFEGRNSRILEVLAEADAFDLVDNNNIKQLSDKELESMNGIRSCRIEGCDAIETIVGTSGGVVLPSLEHLFIKNLPMLESILRGPLQPESLAKLTTLELTGCQSLVTVFPPGSIQQLCEIQRLKIEKCDKIVEIIQTSGAGAGGILLPKLKKMILLDMEKLESICASKTFWPSLEELEIFKCPGLLKLPFNKDNVKILKRIDADPEWWGKLQFQYDENKEWLQKLRNLR